MEPTTQPTTLPWLPTTIPKSSLQLDKFSKYEETPHKPTPLKAVPKMQKLQNLRYKYVSSPDPYMCVEDLISFLKEIRKKTPYNYQTHYCVP